MSKDDYNKLIIRNLHVDMFIGVLDFEKEAPQPVIVNVEAYFTPTHSFDEKIENTADYSKLVDAIETIAKTGHTNLVETFAEKIAAACLKQDHIDTVMVKIEKPEIYKQADAVGIEIKRSK